MDTGSNPVAFIRVDTIGLFPEIRGASGPSSGASMTEHGINRRHGVGAPPGSTAVFRVTGVGGGTWHLVQTEVGWDLQGGDPGDATATLTTDAGAAWRRMTNHSAIHAPALEGDPLLGAAMADALAIIV